MRYVFVDDSALSYDGYTSSRRPLGGPEKAVGGLASALHERGHDVKVINRTSYAHMAEGAYWTPFGDSMAPKAADVLVGLRKPALLGTLRAATHRLLWVLGEPSYLTAAVNAPLWDSFNAGLMFISPTQRAAYSGKVRNAVIVPGVRSAFYEKPIVISNGPDHTQFDYANSGMAPEFVAAEQAVTEAANVPEQVEPPPPPPPHAIVTTHPSQGLSWLVDVWKNKIHPEMPEARLAVYSAVLTKGLKGEEIPAAIAPILQQVKDAASANVVVVEPRSDDGMAEVYRTSRVHLYPGDVHDYACWTLAESQSAGLPAVARNLGGTPERIDNGQTGFIVPDAAAFANVTLQILGNDAVHKNFNEAAVEIARRRTWALAAAELDDFVATLPAA
jgi:glycosyltransferase involved in cell wall biosynthesis